MNLTLTMKTAKLLSFQQLEHQIWAIVMVKQGWGTLAFL